MPRAKKKKSEPERARQKERTRKNKIEKYSNLLKLNPNSPHRKKWEKQVEYLK